ncbi:Rhodanese-like protein, partial [Calocera viscosa TUFC12733]
QKILLIDVREPDEIAQGSIPSAVALPLSQLHGALKLSPAAFEARYGFPLPGPSQPALSRWSGKAERAQAQAQQAQAAQQETEQEGEKGKEIIFFCRSGKRSLTACDLAVKAGWKGVKNYDGSWLDWTAREMIKQ